MGCALIAKKLGSTLFIDESGLVKHITVLKVENCVVFARKSVSEHGYRAVQLAAFDCKASSLRKPQRVIYEMCNIPYKSVIKEFRIGDDEEDLFPDVGELVKPSLFASFPTVKVTGISKGKGFAGVMKRHGFGGQPATHGVSVSHRSLGSTGQRTSPSRVFKNTKMPGRMGGKQATISGLEVVKFCDENGFLCLKGAVPGAINSVVFVKGDCKRIISNEG